MEIGLLILRFRLPGCYSLKEKRGRMSGIRERIGRQTHLALRECGCQDDHDIAEWALVAVGHNRDSVFSALDKAEAEIEDLVDAVIINSQRDII